MPHEKTPKGPLLDFLGGIFLASLGCRSGDNLGHRVRDTNRANYSHSHRSNRCNRDCGRGRRDFGNHGRRSNRSCNGREANSLSRSAHSSEQRGRERVNFRLRISDCLARGVSCAPGGSGLRGDRGHRGNGGREFRKV